MLENATSFVVEGDAELVEGVDRIDILVKRYPLQVQGLLSDITRSQQEADAGGGLAALLLLGRVGAG